MCTYQRWHHRNGGVRESGVYGMLGVWGVWGGEIDMKNDGEAPPHGIYLPTFQLHVPSIYCVVQLYGGESPYVRGEVDGEPE